MTPTLQTNFNITKSEQRKRIIVDITFRTRNFSFSCETDMTDLVLLAKDTLTPNPNP